MKSPETRGLQFKGSVSHAEDMHTKESGSRHTSQRHLVG